MRRKEARDRHRGNTATWRHGRGRDETAVSQAVPVIASKTQILFLAVNVPEILHSREAQRPWCCGFGEGGPSKLI
jgi:hypothetical protein